MRKPTLTPATLRDSMWEVIGENGWDPNMPTAEKAAVEHALAAALTPLVADRAKREDVGAYLLLLDDADALDRLSPQSDTPLSEVQEWERDMDATEYKIAAIGARIVGTP